MRFLFALIFLSGCFHSIKLQDTAAMQTLSPPKQKQRIAALQKKLQAAEKEQRAAEAEVERLVMEIEEAQVALIRRQVDDYERKTGYTADLFLEEREALYQIIRSGPGPASFNAQIELDRILRLITERSDEGR
jgi:t-SNARE complex subunit (syntaxin)